MNRLFNILYGFFFGFMAVSLFIVLWPIILFDLLESRFINPEDE